MHRSCSHVLRAPHRPRLVCALIAGSLLASSLSLAQTPADIDAASRQADQLRRQQEEQLRRDREAANPVLAPGGLDTRPLAPRPDASGAGAGCRNIDQIALDGATLVPVSERVKIAQKFAGTCIGVPQVEQLMGELTKYYVDRGYITTRVYLPEQDLRSGTLKLLVVEGRIEKITVDDGGRGSIALANVLPEFGDQLNLRDIEQGMDQINKLASNNATLDIKPGSQPGVSEVVIINKASNPLHAYLTLDNLGSPSTGRQQVGATVSVDNLLRLNELLSVTVRRSYPNDRATKYSSSESFTAVVPWRYHTFTLSANESRYVSTIVAPSGATLQTAGNSSTKIAGVDSVVYRDQRNRVTLGGAITNKTSENYLAGQFLGVSSRTLSVADLNASVATVGPLGVLVVDAGYSRGIRFAGALSDPAGLPDSAPHAQFRKWRYGYNYTYAFEAASQRFTFNSTLTGQKALDTLYGSEQMSVGGFYTVRGFVNSSLAGDDGYYVRNELSMYGTLPVGSEKISTRVYAGLDHGRVTNRVAGVPQGSLTGAVLGARLSLRDAAFELTASRPVSKPAFLTREPTQYWARLSYSF